MVEKMVRELPGRNPGVRTGWGDPIRPCGGALTPAPVSFVRAP
jgi:hypothetical protein